MGVVEAPHYGKEGLGWLREKEPRENSLHAPVRTNPTLQNCAAELASLKQSSHCLKAPFFSRRICYLPSRYRNNKSPL